MLNKNRLKTIAFIVAGIALVLGAGYSFLRWVFAADPDACISKGLQTIPDLSGAKIEIVYVSCDTLAKEEETDVYLSPVTAQGTPGLKNGRTLVFSYDPVGSDNSVPSITNPSDSTILITVPEVSSVIHQDRSWRGMSIEYAIGKDYSANPK